MRVCPRLSVFFLFVPFGRALWQTFDDVNVSVHNNSSKRQKYQTVYLSFVLCCERNCTLPRQFFSFLFQVHGPISFNCRGNAHEWILRRRNRRIQLGQMLGAFARSCSSPHDCVRIQAVAHRPCAMGVGPATRPEHQLFCSVLVLLSIAGDTNACHRNVVMTFSCCDKATVIGLHKCNGVEKRVLVRKMIFFDKSV
jgi:hypothetical protein